jgi:predicted component of type VI protein secretion system
MAIYLVVLSGSKLGTKSRVSDGFTIGRKEGDLTLEDDPKVSGTHAKVSMDSKGIFILNDLGSSNGLVVNGQRLKKLALMPGVIFRVGHTEFRVIKEGSATEDLPVTSLKAGSHDDEPTINREAETAPGVEKSWKDKLFDHLNGSPQSSSSQGDAVLGAFSPALVLDFIEGLQAEQKITLGYGPREAGFGNWDINLIDPSVPELAFKLVPGPGSVEIRDLSGGQLLINNRSPELTFLKEGDIIGVGQTKIKVRYL